MPPAAPRVAHTTPSAEPHRAGLDQPSPSPLGAPAATATLRVTDEQIGLINQLLARLQFARDANDPARMLGVLGELDTETGILELVIQRSDNTAPVDRTDDPLAHARAVARRARSVASTARAQAEGMKAAETGSVSRLGSAPAPTSIGETRRRARELGEPGICDDATMLDHTSVSCSLTAPQRETTRVMATTSLDEIASNWMSALHAAEIETNLAPLLEHAGPDPVIGLLVTVGVSLAGLGVGSALALAVTTGGEAIKEVAKEGGEAATEHWLTPESGPDADRAASPMFDGLEAAASSWNKVATREVRMLADPQLVALAESIEDHPYSRGYFTRALTSLLANYRQIAKVGQRRFGQLADEAEIGLLIAPDGTQRLATFRQELGLTGEMLILAPTGRLEFVAWVDPALTEVARSKVVMPEVLMQTDRRWVSAPPPPPRAIDVLKRPGAPTTT